MVQRKCRYVIEVINGIFKQQFKALKETQNIMLSHICDDYKIAAAQINVFFSERISDKEDQNEISRQMKTALPVSVVENNYFKKFLSLLSSSFKLPSRFFLSNRILDAQYSITKQAIQGELNEAEAVAITLDCWTSVQRYPYLGITVHFFDSNVNFCSRTLTI
ncbi:unnamed protein product [Brachionus calyciflorus]|uniref:Uncharacterized protein n=1 Tax=Brachionus calyciflorus TaxID=104777 RepID=A0A814BRW7_9BILA|nr:unnamed protein product [Brachionus calyciflorus]